MGISVLHVPAGYGMTAWLTGLSGAGKSSIGRNVAGELRQDGVAAELLDGDDFRREHCWDLGFSRADREESCRRLAGVANGLAQQGVIVIVAAICPYRELREKLRSSGYNFLEIYVNAPLAVCESRDPKGLYRRARRREICNFTGVDDPYEPPTAPDLECKTDREMLDVSVQRTLLFLRDRAREGSRVAELCSR